MNTMVETMLAPLLAASTAHPAPVRIRSVALQKRGPDGKQRAESVSLDFGKTLVDSDGQVSGGTVSVVSRFKNVLSSGAQVHFGSNGQTVSANTTQYDRFAGGVFRTIETDLKGLQQQLGRIVEGTLSFKSADRHGKTLHTGKLTFAKEKLASVDIEALPSSFDATGRKVNLDFSATKFLGSEIVGGSVAMTSHLANGHLVAEATTNFSAHGLPQSSAMKVYSDTESTLTATIETDYAKVTFNGLKEIDAGSLAVTTRRPDGTLACRGSVSYQGSVPSGYQAEAYDRRGTTQRRIRIDYSKAQFNQARTPINSAITVYVADGKNNPLSETTIYYGADGTPIRRVTRATARRPSAAETVSEVDCRDAVFDTRGAIVAGRTTTVARTGDTVVTVVRSFAGTRRCATKERTVAAAGAAKPHKWSKTYYRPDGTALKRANVNADTSGKPVSGTVVNFGTDGRTVLSKRAVDYTGLTYTNGAPSGGHVSMATKDGTGRARSSAVVAVG